MSERVADINAHVESIRQLSLVVSAMRSIAAARSHEARAQLAAIQSYAGMISNAIGEALHIAAQMRTPEQEHGGERHHLVIGFGAEQGFAGAFNDHVLRRVAALAGGAEEQVAILLVGSRAALLAHERGIAAERLAPMMARADQASSLAGRICDELYARLDRGGIVRVSLVYAAPSGGTTPNVLGVQVVPFDFTRFPQSEKALGSITTLEPAEILATLAEEYVFAQICEALVLSFAAENEARVRSMAAAQDHVSEMLDGLVARSQQLRQEEITSEIVELSAAAASMAYAPR